MEGGGEGGGGGGGGGQERMGEEERIRERDNRDSDGWSCLIPRDQ